MEERRFPKVKLTLDWDDYAVIPEVKLIRRDPPPVETFDCAMCREPHPSWHFSEEMRGGKTPLICMPCLHVNSPSRSFGKRDWTLPWADQTFLHDAAAVVLTLEREAKRARV